MVPSFFDFCMSWFRTWTWILKKPYHSYPPVHVGLLTRGVMGKGYILSPGWTWDPWTGQTDCEQIGLETEHSSSTALYTYLTLELSLAVGFRVNLGASHLARQRDNLWSLFYRTWHELGPSSGSEGLWEISDLGILQKWCPQMSHQVSPRRSLGVSIKHRLLCRHRFKQWPFWPCWGSWWEEWGQKNGGCPTRATGGLSQQWVSFPHLHPGLTMKSFPCRIQRLAKTILLSTVDLITLFYVVVTY